MLSQLFLGISLTGAEWVLYVLLLLSVLSVALMVERWKFYRDAGKGLNVFRQGIRKAAQEGNWEQATHAAIARTKNATSPDLEAGMTAALLSSEKSHDPEILTQIAQDEVVRARLAWDKNLVILATIGANAPFIGLFGTVLGIIKAFHDLSTQQGGAGAQAVSSGLSEALVATAMGLLVAIPAVIAYNLFQRRVKSAVAEAEALKSFLIGRLAGK